MSYQAWEFNDEVAQQFDQIARTNIPHYEQVIEKSVSITTGLFPDRAKTRIIDVGSALGHTMERFIEAGYTEVFGVDNSPAMLAHSRVKQNLIDSDTFPKHVGPFHVIIANWTLHFIRNEHERLAYIHDIYGSLASGGILILTDKMHSTPHVHERYMEFKREMGVSEEAITKKTAQVQGVLVPLPVTWYVTALNEAGFETIEIVDAQWCFNTFLCHKR
mgnify:CR=1 FL=1